MNKLVWHGKTVKAIGRLRRLQPEALERALRNARRLGFGERFRHPRRTRTTPVPIVDPSANPSV